MSDPNATSPNAGPWNGGPPGSDGGTTGSGPSGNGDPRANWRDMRRAQRDARRQWRQQHGWGPGFGFPVGGVVILAIGVVFLLGNFGFHLPSHWWAVVLLIPAVGLLVTAIRFYRVEGPKSPRVMGPAIGGGLLLALALAIFFGLNWGLFWPVVLIVVGLAIVGRRWMR